MEQCNIKGEVSLEVKENSIIIIKPLENKLRKDWDKYFKMMKAEKEGRLIINDNLELGTGDWEWPLYNVIFF